MSGSSNADRPAGAPRSRFARGAFWQRRGQAGSHAAAVAWGILLVVVGVWLFLDQSLGIAMPQIPWRDLWPLLIIAFGLWIMLRAVTGRRR